MDPFEDCLPALPINLDDVTHQACAYLLGRFLNELRFRTVAKVLTRRSNEKRIQTVWTSIRLVGCHLLPVHQRDRFSDKVRSRASDRLRENEFFATESCEFNERIQLAHLADVPRMLAKFGDQWCGDYEETSDRFTSDPDLGATVQFGKFVDQAMRPRNTHLSFDAAPDRRYPIGSVEIPAGWPDDSWYTEFRSRCESLDTILPSVRNIQTSGPVEELIASADQIDLSAPFGLTLNRSERQVLRPTVALSPTTLTPRLFGFLSYLVERHPSSVDNEELRREWDTICGRQRRLSTLSETGLTTARSELNREMIPLMLEVTSNSGRTRLNELRSAVESRDEETA